GYLKQLASARPILECIVFMATSVNKALKDAQKGAAIRRLGRMILSGESVSEAREVPRASPDEKDKRRAEGRRKAGEGSVSDSGRGISNRQIHEVGEGSPRKPPGRKSLKERELTRQIDTGFTRRRRQDRP